MKIHEYYYVWVFFCVKILLMIRQVNNKFSRRCWSLKIWWILSKKN